MTIIEFSLNDSFELIKNSGKNNGHIPGSGLHSENYPLSVGTGKGHYAVSLSSSIRNYASAYKINIVMEAKFDLIDVPNDGSRKSLFGGVTAPALILSYMSPSVAEGTNMFGFGIVHLPFLILHNRKIK
ncbi:hypothetical protein [Oenococcus kitaharae]|uniref:hypothetical protein n=1 Tax=Oenococcus kitaharae TaxID=336988 RepID=UPI0011D0BAA5|nr:hypothetical protein [Oenococcus kitaharae]